MANEKSFIQQIEDKKLFTEPGFEKELPLLKIKTVLRLVSRLEGSLHQSTLEENGIVLTLVGKKESVHEPEPMVYYFKCDENGKSFFLKHSRHPRLMGSGGHKEALGNAQAQKILDEQSIDWAEVIKFKLGYTAKKELFFVSEWKDKGSLQSLSEYFEGLDKISGDEDALHRYRKVEQRFKRLKELFTDFFDFHPHNIWIDVESDKIFLFDLTLLNTSKT